LLLLLLPLLLLLLMCAGRAWRMGQRREVVVKRLYVKVRCMQDCWAFLPWLQCRMLPGQGLSVHRAGVLLLRTLDQQECSCC
jgi:hypothetical protein